MWKALVHNVVMSPTNMHILLPSNFKEYMKTKCLNETALQQE